MSHQAKLRVRVQILLLVFQLLKVEVHSKQMDRLMKVIYETLLDPSCLHSNITELFLELVYNAFKNDHSVPRVMAGLKRLLQNAIHADSNVAVAVLIFVNKLAKSVTGLNQLLKNNFTQDFEDEEEGNQTKEKQEDEGLEKDNGGYDYFKRDPLYARADCSLLWELKYFTNHYHPTVRKIAFEMSSSLSTGKVNYESNPLLDFTTASFLDRFSMKKPKAGKVQAKKKLIESNKVSRAKIEEPFSLQAVLQDSESQGVREDEQFMKTYFKKKVDHLAYVDKLEKRKQLKAKFKLNEDEEAEDAFADELFENELRKAEGGRNTYLEDGEGDDDYGEEEQSEDEEDVDLDVDDFDDQIREDAANPDLDFEDDGVTLKKRAAKNDKRSFTSKPKKHLKR